jgi:hypothetical protein
MWVAGGPVKKSSYYYFSSTPKEEAHKYAPKPIDAATAVHAPPFPSPPCIRHEL